jgi:hypothetical protein
MMYIPRNFKAQELVDPITFGKFGADSLRYFRPSILIAMDWIHDNYPFKGKVQEKRSVTVNTWHIGGTRQWSGLRIPGCPEYKPHSAHSWGAGIDSIPSGITMDEFRAWILETHESILREGHLDHPLMGIRRMEVGTPTWAHLDGLDHGGAGILLVNP